MEDLTRYEQPMSPVRDDSALPAVEDLDREPDGIPHEVIAGIVGTIFVTAAILFGLLTGHVPALAAVFVLIGLLAVGKLLNRAAQQHRVAGPHASR